MDKKDTNKSVQSGKAVVSTGSKTTYTKTDPAVWLSVKADWESGLYELQELRKKYNLNYDNMIKHIYRKKWVKGKDLATIQANVAEKNRRIFEKHGITDDLIALTLVAGLTEPKVIVFEGKGEAMQANTEPDYKTRLDYIKECNKMLGSHVGASDGPQQPKEGDKHVHLHIQPREGETPQESLASYLTVIRGENS